MRAMVVKTWYTPSASGYGLNFLDDNRKVILAVQDILRIIADNELGLASSHYSYADTAGISLRVPPAPSSELGELGIAA